MLVALNVGEKRIQQIRRKKKMHTIDKYILKQNIKELNQLLDKILIECKEQNKNLHKLQKLIKNGGTKNE